MPLLIERPVPRHLRFRIKNRWLGGCTCGWRSKPMRLDDDAYAAAHRHCKRENYRG